MRTVVISLLHNPEDTKFSSTILKIPLAQDRQLLFCLSPHPLSQLSSDTNWLLRKDTITAPEQTDCPHSTKRLHDDFEAVANKYHAQLLSMSLLKTPLFVL
jgi:hypothetical protein